jgi:SAM-dependent methyltransferase
MIDHPLEIPESDFGPVSIDAATIRELAAFTGRPIDFCADRLWHYNSRELGEAWHRANPQTGAEMRAFYGNTDLYLWELPKWHGSPSYAPYLRAVETIISRQRGQGGPLRALDYGSGIGTTAVRLARAGYQVTIADVPGPTFDFARYRLATRGLPYSSVDITSDYPDLDGGFDAIVCFDVLEHVQDPERVWKHLEKHLRDDGLIAVVASYDAQPDFAAYHLRENYLRWGEGRWKLFMHGRGFERVEDLVFKRRGLPGRVIARGRYWLWRTTTLTVQRVPLRVK